MVYYTGYGALPPLISKTGNSTGGWVGGNLSTVSKFSFIAADAERQQQAVELERAKQASVDLSTLDPPRSSLPLHLQMPIGFTRPKKVSFENASPFEQPRHHQ